MNATDILALLRTRYAPPAWAFVSDVANGTGSYARRRADAVAMSLWPSRGLTIHGFEIKVSRGDFIRELKQPEKAESVASSCDFWWLVAPPDIVRDGELPDAWGLLVAKGGQIRQVKEARALHADIDEQRVRRPFVAALLRAATENMVPRSLADGDVAERVRAGVEEQLATATRDMECRAMQAEDAFRYLRASVDNFHAASGVEIDQYNGAQIGEAVKVVLATTNQFGGESVRRRAEQLRQLARDSIALADRFDAAMNGGEVG